MGHSSSVRVALATVLAALGAWLPAAASAVTWAPLGPGMDASLEAVAAGPDNAIYAGGNATGTGDSSLAFNQVAGWGGASWAMLGTPSANGVTGPSGTVAVHALATDSAGNVYVGGNFNSAGGVAATNIAKWDGSGWSALGSGIPGTVSALAVDGLGNLWAGGTFSTAGGLSANNIAKWNGSQWSTPAPGTNNSVYALAADGAGNVYAGGLFTSPAAKIARWDGSSWSALGAGMSNNGVFALAIDGLGGLYAGGTFSAAGGVTVNRIARWNGSTWSGLGSGTPGVNDTVLALTRASDGSVIAGGRFTTAGGSGANYVARWDGSAWSTLGDGTDYRVFALATASDGRVVVGGSFTQAGGIPANRIATVDLAEAPGAPQDVSAGAGDSTATVTWSAPASDGGAPVSSYTVTSQPGGHTCTGDGAASACTVTGLTNGQPYTFTVVATNRIGPGPASVASSAVTPAALPLPGPLAPAAQPGPESRSPTQAEFAAVPTITQGPTFSPPGTIIVTVTVPEAGTITAVGTRSGTTRACISRPRTMSGAGSTSLTCRLNTATRAALRRHAVTVSVRARFAPTSGGHTQAGRTIRIARQGRSVPVAG